MERERAASLLVEHADSSKLVAIFAGHFYD